VFIISAPVNRRLWILGITMAALLLIVFPTLLILTWIRLMQRKKLERASTAYEREIQPDNQWISDRAWRRICFGLHKTGSPLPPEEQHVLLTHRKIGWQAIFAALPFAIAGVLVLGIGIVGIVAIPESIRGQVIPAYQIRLVIALITIVLVLVSAMLSAIAILPWYSWHRIVTNEGVIDMKVPPIWFPWMDDPVNFLPFAEAKAFNQETSGLGNLLHYGRIDPTTLQQKEDDEQWKQDGIPNPVEALSILRGGLTAQRALAAESVATPAIGVGQLVMTRDDVLRFFSDIRKHHNTPEEDTAETTTLPTVKEAVVADAPPTQAHEAKPDSSESPA